MKGKGGERGKNDEMDKTGIRRYFEIPHLLLILLLQPHSSTHDGHYGCPRLAVIMSRFERMSALMHITPQSGDGQILQYPLQDNSQRFTFAGRTC